MKLLYVLEYKSIIYYTMVWSACICMHRVYDTLLYSLYMHTPGIREYIYIPTFFLPQKLCNHSREGHQPRNKKNKKK